MIYPFFLLLLSFTPVVAQDGYQQWLDVQGNTLHLRADCRIKKYFVSANGKDADLRLRQVQFYQNQRLVQDKMYQQNSDLLLYNIQISYFVDNTAKGINLMDSSEITYAFNEQQKIRYYVLDQQSFYHVVYSYNDSGQLLRCKDCMDPFGNHQWCAFYNYEYDKSNRLKKVLSYNLPKNKPNTEKVLFAIDSLVYQKDTLRKIVSKTPQGKISQILYYRYDNKGRISFEKRQLMPAFVTKKSIVKLYNYSIEDYSKEITTNYYDKEYRYGYQIELFDYNNRLVLQASYNDAGDRTVLYKMEYD